LPRKRRAFRSALVDYFAVVDCILRET